MAVRKYRGKEKREYPRMHANFIVSYRIKHPSGDYDLTQTKDVSQGGMLLTTNKPFEKGTYLTLTMRFPFIPQKIELTGKVADSKEINKNLIYETRIQFLDLDRNSFEKLGKFIKKNFK